MTYLAIDYSVPDHQKHQEFATLAEAQEHIDSGKLPNGFAAENPGGDIDFWVVDMVAETVTLDSVAEAAAALQRAKQTATSLIDDLRDVKKSLSVFTEGETVDAGTLSSGAMANEMFAYDGRTLAINSITRIGSIASFVFAKNHHLDTGQTISSSGADQTEYSGEFVVTETGKKTLDVTVTGTPDTPATGTITALTKSYAWIDSGNNVVFWTDDKFKSIHRDTTKYERDCVRHARSMKDDVLVSTTVSEIDAIDITAGWPATGV